jgi:hypothetical protein
MRRGRATLRARTVSALAMVSLVVSMLAVTAPAATAKTLLVTGLAGGSGSTVGPDGALYVTEGLVGRVSRVDPLTGAVTTFASGLPPSIIGIGGAIDVVFKDGTAYVLVTLVGADVGGTAVNGIYRVDGASTFTVIADIGAFAIANPPTTAFDVPSGVQYAIDNLGGDFVVTDGHHNRLYRVTLGGTVTQLIQFDNDVPTGLEVRGDRIFVAQAGPVPHVPRDGKVVRFRAGSSSATEVASGGRLLVDVEFGADRRFALSQGHFTPGQPPGSPADPDTGRLLRFTDGGFTAIAWRLDRPTSFEIIRRTAYVVTLDGEIWKVRLRGDD